MERLTHKENLLRLFLTGAGLYLVKEIAFLSASFAVREEVRKRANGKCETCKREIPKNYSVVAHENHDKNNGHYDDPEKLTNKCMFCETELHLTNFHTPEKLGLTKWSNAFAAYRGAGKLTKEDYSLLLDRHSKLFAKLIRYLDFEP